MHAAITNYRYLGQYEYIVNESFDVIDETCDCKRLFADLEKRLNCLWDLMYAEAKKYYCEHGNLMVPGQYVSPNGIMLGSWIASQRMIRNGKQSGKLTVEQIERLGKIGMVWNADGEKWRVGYAAALVYNRHI